MAPRTSTVLFFAPEPLEASLTGPTRRTVKLAEQVAERCRVTLAAPAPSVWPDGPFETRAIDPGDDRQLAAAFADHDVTVVQALPSPRQLFLAMRHARRLVVDLIAPLALEVAETAPPGPARDAIVRWRSRQLVAHLAAADLTLCTNEKQRDLLIGAALAAGLLASHRGSGPLHERIAVVPHGLGGERPRRGGDPLRKAGLVAPGDRIAVWGGGIWSWLDPITAMRAIERLRPSRPDLKLAFVGFEHPDPVYREAHAAATAAATSYAEDEGLGEAVVFLPRWLDRDEYLSHLAEADVGVVLHGLSLEGRFASRTRVLDYLTAGLPVVCSSGDTMSEVVAAEGLGAVVQPLDVDDCAAALDRLTQGPRRAPDRPPPAALEWANVARPLVAYCAEPGAPRRVPLRAAAASTVRSYSSFLRALHADAGPGELQRAVTRRALTRIRARGRRTAQRR